MVNSVLHALLVYYFFFFQLFLCITFFSFFTRAFKHVSKFFLCEVHPNDLLAVLVPEGDEDLNRTEVVHLRTIVLDHKMRERNVRTDHVGHATRKKTKNLEAKEIVVLNLKSYSTTCITPKYNHFTTLLVS